MIRMATVWERTVDVLRGRAAILAGIAFVTLFLPTVSSAAVTSFVGDVQAARLLASLVSAVLMLFGMLAITAVASDPRVDRGAAYRLAANRLPAAIGVTLVLVIALSLTFVPGTLALIAAGATVTATGMVEMQRAAAGPLALSAGLILVAAALLLWLGARLAPLFAVVVNERLGLGAIRRAFALTRGAAARLIGVLILYAVLVMVLSVAVRSVVGVVLRLLLDSDAAVLFGTSVALAIVSAGATVVQNAFYAQYYAAAREREEAAPSA
ncbi:hypothetical protein KZ820_19065 [Sphingomonas sp. RRHST34]|jgi:hypothetical protein|uniref:Glycerophosphoryl diester phosphodiesterase membrane domain-containing protein n=1 Tax=Sphingomonas citri TaxID=2862499 RepID=A0ABS7BTJ4_9SPHN|nr:hypothetical protein [Sphingomonas citri]MBW6532850.1 hypothetical protein [Sphingomonas citri]